MVDVVKCWVTNTHTHIHTKILTHTDSEIKCGYSILPLRALSKLWTQRVYFQSRQQAKKEPYFNEVTWILGRVWGGSFTLNLNPPLILLEFFPEGGKPYTCFCLHDPQSWPNVQNLQSLPTSITKDCFSFLF